jgi:hypothetical protein
VFGEDVSDVTPAQFAWIKKFVTATLADNLRHAVDGREPGHARQAAQVTNE